MYKKCTTFRRNCLIISLVCFAMCGVTGCIFTVERLDRTEKAMLAGNFVLHGVDAAQTMEAMDRGYTEANPLLGSHPSDTEIIGLKVLVGGLTYLIVCNLPEDAHMEKKLLLGLLGLGTGAVVMHNAGEL